MSGQGLGHIWAMSGPCLGYVWATSGTEFWDWNLGLQSGTAIWDWNLGLKSWTEIWDWNLRLVVYEIMRIKPGTKFRYWSKMEFEDWILGRMTVNLWLKTTEM